MTFLKVYTTSHCLTRSYTQQLLAQLTQLKPALNVELVDLDALESEIPSFIIGTPTFVWNNQVIFLGNPTLPELLARIGDENR